MSNVLKMKKPAAKPPTRTRCDVRLVEANPNPLRPLNDDVVKTLAASMAKIGLMTPITVRFIETEDEDRWELVSGRHRLAAAISLGWPRIDTVEIQCSDVDAKLWEIAENLHRAELTALQRDEQVALWIKLTDSHASQVGTHKKGQQPGGINAAARELNVKKTDARRAVKVASLSDKAKAAAVEHGLDDNRTAMLEAAKETEPEKQVARIVERANKPKSAPAVADDVDDGPDPAVLEDNILYSIGGMNANARVYRKLLKVCALDTEAVARITTATDKMVVKWRSMFAVNKPKPAPAVQYPTDPDDDEPGDTDEEIATRGFMYRASESASMAHYPLKDLVVTDEIIAAARDAVDSWTALLAKLSEDQIATAEPGSAAWKAERLRSAQRSGRIIEEKIARDSAMKAAANRAEARGRARTLEATN